MNTEELREAESANFDSNFRAPYNAYELHLPGDMSPMDSEHPCAADGERGPCDDFVGTRRWLPRPSSAQEVAVCMEPSCEPAPAGGGPCCLACRPSFSCADR